MSRNPVDLAFLQFLLLFFSISDLRASRGTEALHILDFCHQIGLQCRITNVPPVTPVWSLHSQLFIWWRLAASAPALVSFSGEPTLDPQGLLTSATACLSLAS